MKRYHWRLLISWKNHKEPVWYIVTVYTDGEDLGRAYELARKHINSRFDGAEYDEARKSALIGLDEEMPMIDEAETTLSWIALGPVATSFDYDSKER